MGKIIKRIKIISSIIILVELLATAFLCGFYFSNFNGFQQSINVDYVIFISACIVLIDCVLVWVFCIRISSLRQKTDLHAAEVIGNDIQEAYNFAMLGLAVTDEKDVVLWTNDLFKTRHIDIIDTNIFEWNPELINLKKAQNSDATVKIEIFSRNYEVKFLSEAGLWIFKDISDFESIYKYSKEQAPVVGILSIDNYDEVFRTEEDYNDVATKVKNVIFNYAKEYGILLRRFKDENYSMLCNFDSFSKMKEDNFSIIDKVREVSAGEEIPLTLSIGLAHDFPDVVKLNELAKSALEIAMSRGGDQVVVSVYGSEMEFYGGKTNAQEKRNRVKIRVLADSFISLLKGSKDVLIMGHKNMDMDSLGACLGVKAICDRLNKPAQIVIDYKLTEAKTRSALTSSFSKEELEKIVISPHDAFEACNSETLLVVVDVHIPNMVMTPDLLDNSIKIVVIDHHRRAEEYIDSPVFNHIDPAASSTCEIITEFIKFCSINPRIELPATYATIMLSGIFLDSSYFKSKSTGIRTFEASTILKEYGADNSMADDLLKDDYEEYVEVNKIVQTIKTPYYGVVYAHGDMERIYDTSTIAKAANTCLSMKGIHAAFVFAKTSNKETRMSCRSDGMINVQYIAEKLGGGGHFTSSAVVLDKTDLSQVESELINVLDKYLNDAKADAKQLKGSEEQ